MKKPRTFMNLEEYKAWNATQRRLFWMGVAFWIMVAALLGVLGVLAWSFGLL